MTAAARSRPTVIELLEPDQLLIVWEDGHESLYPHDYLRRACNCARCRDEWTGEPLLDPSKVPPTIRVVRWQPTGNYGINLYFSDGHSTGIYTFKELRNLCPCGECPGEGESAEPEANEEKR